MQFSRGTKAMSSNTARYRVKSGDPPEVAILPGENPIEFERLHTRLAQEWAPDGVLEEDTVLMIAKCIWRKRRYQRFVSSKFETLSVDTDGHQKDQHQLKAFHKALIEGA